MTFSLSNVFLVGSRTVASSIMLSPRKAFYRWQVDNPRDAPANVALFQHKRRTYYNVRCNGTRLHTKSDIVFLYLLRSRIHGWQNLPMSDVRRPRTVTAPKGNDYSDKKPRSTFRGNVTPSVMWQFDSPCAISCWWSFGTKRLSLTVSVIHFGTNRFPICDFL